MSKKFTNGDTVVVGFDVRIPVRYQGRTATVVGKQKTGKGFRYLVGFGDRRVSPLAIPATNLTLQG